MEAAADVGHRRPLLDGLRKAVRNVQRGATRNLVRFLPARDTTRLAGSPPRTPPAQTSVDGIQ